MNFQFYVEKLMNSEIFKKFSEENKDAIPCSGFFVIDLEGQDNKQHFDYFIPLQNKMFSFKLEDNCQMIPVDIVDNIEFKPIFINHNFDFSEIKNIISREMQKRDIKNKVQKILLSLQHKKGKDYLIGTVFISNFGLLSINIDVSNMNVTHFEKKSFFDMLKITRNEPFKKVPKPETDKKEDKK